MPSITLLPDGDSIPLPQHSSQADKYLTNTAMTDPIKMRDPVRVLLKRSCLSPKDTRHKPCQYKPAPVQMSVQQWATSLGGGENLMWSLHTSRYVRHHGQSGALLWCVWYLERVRHQCHLLQLIFKLYTVLLFLSLSLFKTVLVSTCIFKITTNVRLFTWHGRPLFKSTNILYFLWRETQVITEQSCSAHHSTSSHLGYTLAFFHRKTMRNWPSDIGKKS